MENTILRMEATKAPTDPFAGREIDGVSRFDESNGIGLALVGTCFAGMIAPLKPMVGSIVIIDISRPAHPS